MQSPNDQPIKRTIQLIVIAIICLLGAIGYNQYKVSQYEIDSACLTIGSEKVEVPFVIKINTQEVSLDEYRYHYLNMKQTMSEEKEINWEKDTDSSLQRQLKFDALTALKEVYAIEKLALQFQLSLTKREEEQINTDIKTQITSLGSHSDYNKALEESYLTDSLYRKIWKTTFYYEKLYQFYFSKGGLYYDETSQQTTEENEKEIENEVKLHSIIAKTADSLEIKYGPEYDLIRIDTLL